jgi:hypothetical protein
MQTALLLSSWVLGLAGGSHCLAMCGPACVAINQGSASTAAPENPLVFAPKKEATQAGFSAKKPFFRLNFLFFLCSRVLSYALLGALAAGSVQALAWGSGMAQGIKPLWALWHALVLVWGLFLLVLARQPIWAQTAAHNFWQRVSRHPWAGRGSVLGLAWGLLPCGLLYSALLQASLMGQVLAGAAAMALFALGSSVWLLAAPGLWQGLAKIREAWGQRIAGALLIAGAGFAIWQQFQPGGIYCAT